MEKQKGTKKEGDKVLKTGRMKDNLEELHVYQKNNLLKHVKHLILFLIVLLLIQGVYIGHLKWTENNNGVIYIPSPQGTIFASREILTDQRERLDFEVINFSNQWLRDSFAHSANNYRENLNRAMSVMNQQSAAKLRSQFTEEKLYETYKVASSVSTIKITEQHFNEEKYPYKLDIFYNVHMDFLSGNNYNEARDFEQGVALEIISVPRCKENPYGLMINNLKWIQKKK